MESLKDGRFRRYYPGDLLTELEKNVQDRAKKFKADFLERASTGGIKPRVSMFSTSRMVVELTAGNETSALVIPFTPVTSILEGNRTDNRKNKRNGPEEDTALIGQALLKMMKGKREEL